MCVIEHNIEALRYVGEELKKDEDILKCVAKIEIENLFVRLDQGIHDKLEKEKYFKELTELKNDDNFISEVAEKMKELLEAYLEYPYGTIKEFVDKTINICKLNRYIKKEKSMLISLKHKYFNSEELTDYEGTWQGGYYDDTENIVAILNDSSDILLLDVEQARKKARAGKLHLDAPEEFMGQIIGKKGSNINAVTDRLQKRGVNVSKIIMHPKSKEEKSIKTGELKKSIENHSAKTID